MKDTSISIIYVYRYLPQYFQAFDSSKGTPSLLGFLADNVNGDTKRGTARDFPQIRRYRREQLRTVNDILCDNEQSNKHNLCF